jgi:hypothetical protein
MRALVGLYVRLGEEFEVFADELDALSVCAIDNHDVGF